MHHFTNLYRLSAAQTPRFHGELNQKLKDLGKPPIK